MHRQDLYYSTDMQRLTNSNENINNIGYKRSSG